MRYLQNLLFINKPSLLRLLDGALILSIIPHLFVLDWFLFLYISIAIFFIVKRHTPKDSYILLLIGLVLISISFFNTYNFSDFSRMQFFVSLISSLLILAATLQRATKTINFYLKISPALLMLLSFFFFNTIVMLLYSLVVLFMLTLFLMWSRMQTEFLDVFKVTTGLFLLSLPAVVVMFIAFPRISFEKADYGFRADSYATSGYDGKMHVSDKPFSPDERIVMEVYFQDASIDENLLYFRGSTLHSTDGIVWEDAKFTKPKEHLIATKEHTTYDITLYPHGKNWVYALDMPTIAPQTTTLQNDFTISSQKPLYEKKHYQLSSALSYKLITQNIDTSLAANPEKSPKTTKSLQSIKELQANDATKAKLLLDFFKKQDLSYTTQPKEIALDNFLDSFLFEAKNGYCVHFAAAFAQSARLVGIPSRVVTGYKGSLKNRIENYIIIKSADAHSWVELYLDKEGWVRFDPTATAQRNLDMPYLEDEKQETLFQKINLQYMYVKYIITKWVLDYNRLEQMQILKNLLSDTLYLLKFLFGIVMVIVVSLLFFTLVVSMKKSDPIARTISKLLKVLRKKGFVKKEQETIDMFLSRIEVGISFVPIITLYQTLLYSNKKDTILLKQLQKEIKKIKQELFKKPFKKSKNATH
ncbi:MAG: DUF3488 and transglutaminase-like domain-containing protein [Sulfurimonadaceae bacterium]|jgi:predicted nuclease of restriction endonuclease-like (RecB) superfamily|nr:DUF3488 and transglutaminase-like domain-containing protein [Sulfurimonadaceae bacterium]